MPFTLVLAWRASVFAKACASRGFSRRGRRRTLLHERLLEPRRRLLRVASDACGGARQRSACSSQH
eukprot:4343014-Pleurochrysis_carterae.AAC.1